jgi:hypothetical protein
MSLINDALKRAKENQPASAPTPAPDRPMQPVEPPPAETRAGGLPPYFIPAVLIVLCGACWFLLNGWESRRPAPKSPDLVTVQARQKQPASAPGQPALTAPSPEEMRKTGVEDAAIAAIASAASNASTTAGASNATSSPPAVVLPPPPAFKLQGIFYRANNPSAMINARTVFVGDTIDRATVKSIDRQSVTLVQDGETQVLTLY